VRALEGWHVGTPEEIEEISSGKDSRSHFKLSEVDTHIRPYWEKELRLLVDLGCTLRSNLYSAGLEITQWFGPGNIATFLYKKYGIADIMNQELPNGIITASQYAYAGGRFEGFKAGYHNGPVYSADINSAYPFALSSLPNLRTGNWHHFVAISDGTAGDAFGTALYIDGQLEGTVPGPAVLAANAANVKIGDNPGAVGRNWNGSIDDVAIWNRILSPSEIQALYGNGTGDPLSVLLKAAAGTVTITQQPTNTTVLEGTPAQFSVQTTFTGKIPPGYQWQKDGVDIPGAILATYKTPVLLRGNSGAKYTVKATVPGAEAKSNDAVLTVTPDTAPPTLNLVEGLATFDGVTLHFNKPIDAASGTNIANYSIDGGLTISAAALNNGQDVVLTTSAQTTGTKYTITINNVKDIYGNTITANTKVSFSPATLATGLVAYWPFEGNLADSINSFNGTGRGTNPVAFVDGKFGKAIKLDGTDQFVEITGGNSADNLAFPGGSVSIAGWFKVEAFDKNWQALVAKGEGNNWRVARNGSSSTMAYAGGVGDITSGTPVDDGNWHHFVAITDGSGLAFGTALYIDGVQDGSTSSAAVLTKNSKNVFIGENPDSGGRQWNGEIDDMAIWNRVLTEAEITKLYADGAGKELGSLIPPSVKLTNGLVAYWNFDGNLVDSIKDFDGTARGTNPVAFVDGKPGFGKALKLDGTDQYVDITGGNENELEFPNGSMSIAGWFKVNAFDTDWQALISKGEGSNYRVARRASTGTIAYAGGTGEGADDVPPVNDGQWHHFVAVTDADGLPFGTALYVDGVLHAIQTNKPALTASSNHLFIGENPGSLKREFNGQLDDIAIWNRPLNAAEVATLYNNATGTPLSSLPGIGQPSSGTTVSVNRSGSNVVIQWTPAGGTLESTSKLGTGATWSSVGTTNPATIPIGTASQFFRVRQ